MGESEPATKGSQMSELKIGFALRKIRLPLDDILPVRQFKGDGKHVPRYQTILVTLKEMGQVEPLVVHPQKDAPGKYLLLDGHLRYYAMKELGLSVADCIISTDDECFTYNARVSRVPPIQEHKMIMRAVRSGVKPERIAAVLNIPLRVVQASMKLLDGIVPEAAELLKDKNISPKAIRLLKRVGAVRQLEIAELLVDTDNYFTGYVEALVLGTHRDLLADANTPKKKPGLSPEQIAKMEQEMESLERDMKAVGDTFAENMFNLTCARTYIRKLLENPKVAKFLTGNHPEIFAEFENIAASESL
jgi:hypothetical protein